MSRGMCGWEGDTGSALSTLGAAPWLRFHSGAAEEDGGIHLPSVEVPCPMARAGELCGSALVQLAQPLPVGCNEIIQAVGVRASTWCCCALRAAA